MNFHLDDNGVFHLIQHKYDENDYVCLFIPSSFGLLSSTFSALVKRMPEYSTCFKILSLSKAFLRISACGLTKSLVDRSLVLSDAELPISSKYSLQGDY